MEDTLNILTGLTSKERMQAISWIIKLTEDDIINIVQKSVKLSYQLQRNRPDLLGKVVKYCSFILAIRKSGWDSVKGKGYRVAADEQYSDFSQIRQSKVANIINKGRNPVLRRKVVAYWGEVKELKSNGQGFRVISAYLLKNRKIKVSPAYLAIIWKEIESNVPLEI